MINIPSNFAIKELNLNEEIASAQLGKEELAVIRFITSTRLRKAFESFSKLPNPGNWIELEMAMFAFQNAKLTITRFDKEKK